MNILTKVVAGVLVLCAAVMTLPQQASAASSSMPCVQQTFRQGANDVCIGNMQIMLIELGVGNLKIDDQFGPKTKSAVIKWQQKARQTDKTITANGVVDSSTWQSLCGQKQKYQALAQEIGCGIFTRLADCSKQRFSSSRNSRSECVTAIQSMLNVGNNARIAVDGIYGTQTKKAVSKWQAGKKIKDDGIVGPDTWKTLCQHTPGNATNRALYATLKTQVGCKA